MAANTIITSVVTGGTNSHATVSEEANTYATDFVSQGVVGAITLNTGGGGTGSFCVNQDTSPDMGITVKAGQAYIAATPSSQDAQVLRARAASDYTAYTIASNSSGSTKFDWIYLKVDPTKANNPAADASDVTSIFTSRSSSNATDNGSPPTYGLLLAIVTVANGASSITNGNITDKRFNASIGTQGGSLIVTQRSTGLDAIIQAAGVDASVNLDLKPKGSTGVTQIYDGAGNVQFDGSGPIRYEELARLTLGSNGNTMTTPSFTAKKYLRIVVTAVASGSIRPNFRFNADSGNNYSNRNSTNGAADTTSTSQSAIQPVAATTQDYLVVADVMNISSSEKLVIISLSGTSTAGATTAPGRALHVGKWANTSTQITAVTIVNDSTGNFSNAGSEVVVYGSN